MALSTSFGTGRTTRYPSVHLSPGLLWDGYTVVMFESWVRCTVVMKKEKKIRIKERLNVFFKL